RKVAGLHFDGPGAHARCHEALQVRIDRTVLRRDRVVARLRAPRSGADAGGDELTLEWHLHGVQDPGPGFGQVAGEIAQEGGFGQLAFVTVEDDPSGGWRCGEARGEGRV